MNRAVRQIALSAGLLIIICVVCRVTMFRSYTAYVTVYPPSYAALDDGVRAEAEDPAVVRVGKPDLRRDYLRVPVYPGGKGDTFINVYDENDEPISTHHLRVGRFGTVYDYQSGSFTGDAIVLIALTVFWLTVSGIMTWNFFQTKGAAFYAYSTIYFAGFSLFALVTGLLLLRVTVAHLIDPARYTMLEAYSIINGASWQFMVLTMPLILVFAVAMAVSNIALLRHEHPRVQNVLGLIVSAALILGEAVGLYWFSRDFSGSEMEGRIFNTTQNVYATIFVYFECMLAGSVVCGLRAARHEPAPDKDFIIILGCWFRRDGTLPPLLRGRVDRAISFWKRQKAYGREAIFIPSGGQGKNESMPEAEAMRRYLLSQDIPDRLIVPETQARNTYQNMDLSRRLIEQLQPGGKVVFATTNYHVFRSGLWASLAGLEAEGIGGKTKWWFWPNAFMRECAGLMMNRWKQEILMLVLMVGFFALLSMVLG